MQDSDGGDQPHCSFWPPNQRAMIAMARSWPKLWLELLDPGCCLASVGEAPSIVPRITNSTNTFLKVTSFRHVDATGRMSRRLDIALAPLTGRRVATTGVASGAFDGKTRVCRHRPANPLSGPPRAQFLEEAAQPVPSVGSSTTSKPGGCARSRERDLLGDGLPQEGGVGDAARGVRVDGSVEERPRRRPVDEGERSVRAQPRRAHGFARRSRALAHDRDIASRASSDTPADHDCAGPGRSRLDAPAHLRSPRRAEPREPAWAGEEQVASAARGGGEIG